MKIILAAHILTFLLYSCKLTIAKDDLVDFIPGTYFRFSHHEFGKEYDTLVITLQNVAANEYKISRRWKYERVLDGKPVEPEYQYQTTTGIYYSSDKVIQDTETGSLYSFDIKEKVLFNGQVKYKKL